MWNALAMSGMNGVTHEALGNAIERAIAGLGIGSVIALALGALVLGVEALSRRPRRSKKGTGGAPTAHPAERKAIRRVLR